MSRTHWVIDSSPTTTSGQTAAMIASRSTDPAGVLDQQPQQRQRLRPQRHLGAVWAEQSAAAEVEREAVETVGPGSLFGVHRRFLPASRRQS